MEGMNSVYVILFNLIILAIFIPISKISSNFSSD
jgi:hypothetical protein